MQSPQPKPTAGPATKGLKYPYTVHRIYLCGHPDEYVEIDKAPNTISMRITHTIIPPPQGVEGRTVRPYRQTRERCPECAEAHRTSKRHPRSLAAHQSIPPSSYNREKNGFTHVLRRERFFERGEGPIYWPEEREGNPGHDEYRSLKKLHEKVENERNIWPHAAMPFEERVGRRTVEGPMWKGNKKLVYVVQTAVHSVLAPGLGHAMFDVMDQEVSHLRADEMGSLDVSIKRIPAASPHAQDGNNTKWQGGRQRKQPVQPVQPSGRRSPLSNPHFAPTALQSRQVRLQYGQTSPRANTHDPPLSHPRTTSPQALDSPKTTRQRAPSRLEIQNASREQEEIARNRALALQQLEGRAPTAGERHSDTTPQPLLQTPPSTSGITRSEVPSYISHQRPFGPTRPSGGTTLSYGDQPRQYDRPNAQDQESGVSIDAILETLYSSPRNDQTQDDSEQRGSGRGSYGSYRSLESQRHWGPGARNRGSRGSMASFESQRHSRPRSRGSRGSLTSVGSREGAQR